MAADFATVVSQPAPYKHHAYKTSVHYAPMGSGANTPGNVSPTSPRSTNLHMHTSRLVPTIEPRKTPPYVPAALRRTEKPGRQSPPNVDSAAESPNSSWSTGAGVSAPTGTDIQKPISRIQTEDLHTIYNDTPLSPVTGPITRNHWQPDKSTTVCTASACQTPFGVFTRRHHCRKCGGVFCWQHTQKRVRLDEHALFHPEGEEQKACDRCHSAYREWELRRSSRQNSESSDSTNAAPAIDTPTAATRPGPQHSGSLATSVPGFHWSTF